MLFFDNLMAIDYTSLDLKPIEQLAFIKMAHMMFTTHNEELNCSISFLCKKCNCTKPTMHSSLSKLESKGLISIKRTSGNNNVYSLNQDFIRTLFLYPESEQGLGDLIVQKMKQDSETTSSRAVDDLIAQKTKPKVNKNKAKRNRKKNKRR